MSEQATQKRFDPRVTFAGGWYGSERYDPHDATVHLEEQGDGSLLLLIDGPDDQMVTFELDDFNAAIAFLLHEPAS